LNVALIAAVLVADALVVLAAPNVVSLAQILLVVVVVRAATASRVGFHVVKCL